MGPSVGEYLGYELDTYKQCKSTGQVMEYRNYRHRNLFWIILGAVNV